MTILWDNYQREEIEAVLQEYFTELYHLPQPYKTDIGFRLEMPRNIVWLHLRSGGREDLTMGIWRIFAGFQYAVTERKGEEE